MEWFERRTNENASDSMSANSQSLSNELNESQLQDAKHYSAVLRERLIIV
jgi:hypothetical protein